MIVKILTEIRDEIDNFIVKFSNYEEQEVFNEGVWGCVQDLGHGITDLSEEPDEDLENMYEDGSPNGKRYAKGYREAQKYLRAWREGREIEILP